jgi:anti-sigma28 factor (negative regulator of flagellin synthesis)
MMEMNTPPEAFEPDQEGGLEGGGMEEPEMDEMDDEDLAEMGASDTEAAALAENEMADAAAAKAKMDPADQKVMEKMETLKEKIKDGSLKGEELDKALSDVGFSGSDISSLKSVQMKGRVMLFFFDF